MEETIIKLGNLIDRVADFISESPEEKLSFKPKLEKWSKKEILGHLVDSGISNLQRFTEIQFEEKPYKLEPYNQDELVKANHYQISQTKDILNFLIAINKRIIHIINLLATETLSYEIVTLENENFDLKYLIEDYVAHFEHHTNQILE